MNQTRLYLLAAVAAAILAMAGCSSADPPRTGPDGQPLRKVSLVLNWWPEAEHGGFYAALRNGYYEEEGLDVEILPGGVDVLVSPRVASGNVEFGVQNADNVVLARAGGANIVALMAPLQSSPRCIVVHADSGIEGFEDLRDMTLAMSQKAAFSYWVRSKVPLEGVSIVPYPGSVAPFLANPRYAMQGYVFSEPYIARERGADPRVLMVSDLGFDPYTSLLVTSDRLVDQDPQLVQGMVRASLRGWLDYVANPTPTNEYINRLNPEMSVAILEFGAEQMRPLMLTPDVEAGGLATMRLERWAEVVAQLEELDLVDTGAVDPAEAFDTSFLERAR